VRWKRLGTTAIDKCPAILASLFISFQIKSCTMLCWLADDRKSQLEEIVSNFEITNKRIFSVAVRIFKPERWCLLAKRSKRSCLPIVIKILNIDYFCLINICKCLLQWSNWREGRRAIWLPWTAKRENHPRLSLYFGFSILLIGF